MKKSVTRYSSLWHSPGAVLPVLFLLALMPATVFIYGCSAEPVPREAVTDDRGAVRTYLDLKFDTVTKTTSESSWRLVQSLDIFTFHTENGMYLDSYERLQYPGYQDVEVFSGKGKRTVVMVANADLRETARDVIYCYEDLKKIVISYCEDSADYPVMTGECLIQAGEKNKTITLKPLLALLELRSISSSPDLKDVCIYLINASGSAKPFEDENLKVNPSEYLNHGSLKEEDLQKMKYPRMAYQYVGNGKRKNGKTSFGSGSLYCYPNNAVGESAGSPFTKVIIEGLLDKKTVRYSLDINQPGCGYTSGLHGTVRNRRYLFDVEIN